MCLGEGASKCLLVIINIIFFLLGLAAILLGALLLVNDNQILDLLSRVSLNSDVIEEGLYSVSWLTNFAYMMLVGGAFIFFISGLGLFGACCSSPCLLVIYGTCLTLVLVLEIGVVVIGILYNDKIENKLLTFLNGVLVKYYEGMSYDSSSGVVLSSDPTGVSDAFDFAHIEFKCCGVNNYTDFNSAMSWPGNYTVDGVEVMAVVPASCCVLSDYSVWPDDLASVSFVNVTDCLLNAGSTSTNLEGCYDTLKSKIKSYGIAVIVVAVIAGPVIQALGLWGAVSLYRALLNSRVGVV